MSKQPIESAFEQFEAELKYVMGRYGYHEVGQASYHDAKWVFEQFLVWRSMRAHVVQAGAASVPDNIGFDFPDGVDGNDRLAEAVERLASEIADLNKR